MKLVYHSRAVIHSPFIPALPVAKITQGRHLRAGFPGIEKIGEVTERVGLEKALVGLWPYIEIGDINLDSKSINFKDKKSIKGAVIAPKDSILVSRVRPTRGAITLIDKNYPISSAFTILKVKLTEVTSKFLFYQLSNLKPFFIYLQSKQRGSNYPSIRESDILNFKILLPPLTIQKRIVERLDKIAKAQKLNDELISKTDELFQSLLHKELNPTGKNWGAKMLGELFDITSSKRVFESEWTKQGVPFYRAREIVSLVNGQEHRTPIFISEEMFKEYKQKYGVPQEGDILVTGVGTIGISYVVRKTDKFYFKDGNIIWFKQIPKSSVYSKFVGYFFQTLFFKNQIRATSAGATVLTYTIQNAKKTRIPLPPFKIQEQIVAKLSAVQDYKKQLLEQKTKLKELFDSVLHKSMSGELDK